MDIMKELIKLTELTNILEYLQTTREKEEIIELIGEMLDVIKLSK